LRLFSRGRFEALSPSATAATLVLDSLWQYKRGVKRDVLEAES